MIPKDFKGYVGQNRFRISEFIGRGPHGEVYRVEDLLAVKKTQSHAAKFFHFPQKENLPDITEYQTIFDLTDPKSIIKIVDSDQRVIDDQHYYCLIMEQPSGGTLTQVLSLSHQGLPHEPVWGDKLKSILKKICQTLIQIHEVEMEPGYHGNLKPENIFFHQDGSVVLSDFQLAGFHSNQYQGHNPYPPYFAAPEQYEESSRKGLGFWTDIWSFGIIMYQLASAAHPFSGASFDEMKLNITAADNNHNRIEYLPQPLHRIIDKCLAKLPENRYSSTRDLLADLQDVSFTKQCANGHENEYFAVTCSHEKCKARFIEEIADNLVLYTSPWARHTPMPITLSPDEECLFQIELYPDKHPDYNQFRLTGKTATIRFLSPDDDSLDHEKITVDLQPPPKFEIEPSAFNLKWSPSIEKENIRFQLSCSRGEAVVETAQLLMDDKAVQDFYWDGDGTEVRRGKRIEMMAEVDLGYSGRDTEHPLILLLKLKNRNHPIRLDTNTLDKPFSISVMDIPRPHFNLKKQMVFYRGSGEVHNRLDITNIGGGEFYITDITIPVRGTTSMDAKTEQFLRFHLPSNHLKVERESWRAIEYTINLNGIEADHQELDIKLHYQYLRGGDILNEELLQRLRFKLQDLKIGSLVAIDFGTTSSCVMRLGDYFDKDTTPKNITPVDKQKIIASAINYSGSGDKITIGAKAESVFRKGTENAFRSFKRHLGNARETYDLFFSNKPGASYSADRLTEDYIHEILRNIKKEFGYIFDRYVFSHPTKFSLNQHAAFRKIIENCEIDLHQCHFIDEATAGALPFITINEGQYRLVVYDFGGGTIDITYLKVVNSENSEQLKIEVLDTSGLPNFGGDNVTQTIMTIFLASIRKDLEKEDMTLLMPNSKTIDPNIKQFEHTNHQRLLSSCELIKIEELFPVPEKEDLSVEFNEREMSEDFILTKEFKLYLKNNSSKKIKEEIKTFTFSIRHNGIYKYIYKQIDTSVDIIRRMSERDRKRTKEERETFILLTGRSSKLPIVKNLFDAYRNGQCLHWEDSTSELVLIPLKSQKLDYNKLIFADELKELNLSDPMKECVVLGSLTFGASILENNPNFSLDVHALHDRTWSRIGFLRSKGIRIPGTSLNQFFEEWIPKGRSFVPQNGLPPNAGMDKYAMEERSFLFHFDRKRERLISPIILYEHHSFDNDADPSRCSLLGEWNINNVPVINKEKKKGRLRISIEANLAIKVTIVIDDHVIEAHQIK